MIINVHPCQFLPQDNISLARRHCGAYMAAIDRAELEHEQEMGRLRDEVVKLSEEGKL